MFLAKAVKIELEVESPSPQGIVAWTGLTRAPWGVVGAPKSVIGPPIIIKITFFT